MRALGDGGKRKTKQKEAKEGADEREEIEASGHTSPQYTAFPEDQKKEPQSVGDPRHIKSYMASFIALIVNTLLIPMRAREQGEGKERRRREGEGGKEKEGRRRREGEGGKEEEENVDRFKSLL